MTAGRIDAEFFTGLHWEYRDTVKAGLTASAALPFSGPQPTMRAGC